ncbi:TRAP transporter substrate-binding protein [Siminovitchia sediminis]|uniref:TRAP transporter substrate-binding protein n=1 Tax=Siminovitchia sediminis TaxID=1274353 RepID=A0ABW4KMB6_9BACI
MNKKTLFFAIFLSVAVLMIGGCGSSSSGTKTSGVTIKLAHPNVPTHPMGEGFIKFKEMVEDRSNGEIKVEIYDSSKYGDAREVVEGLQLGHLQMGSDSTANVQPFTDGFLVFDMPFLVSDYPSSDQLTDGPIGEKLKNSLEDSGILGLGYIELGFRNYFNDKHPIKTMEDLKGLKIRSTSSEAQIATLKAVGANPTPVAWGEVYTALQQGTVDGIEIDLNLAYHNNFHEVQDYLTIVKSVYSPHLVMINKDFFNGLSEEHKTIIQESFDEMKVLQRKLIRENEDRIIKELEEKGVEVHIMEEKERERLMEATSGVIEEYKDKIGEDLLEEFIEAAQ